MSVHQLPLSVNRTPTVLGTVSSAFQMLASSFMNGLGTIQSALHNLFTKRETQTISVTAMPINAVVAPSTIESRH